MGEGGAIWMGEAMAEFLRTWGPDFDPKGGGRGEGGGRGRVGQVYLCVETISPSCGEGGGMWRGGRALGRIDVGVGYTRGARSRRWCGWYI